MLNPSWNVAIVVRGIVQGVGFRPFVYALATDLNLTGFVRNQTDGVFIEIEGPPASLDRFVELLASNPPPLAKINDIVCINLPTRGDTDFTIVQSESLAGPVLICADVATCDACLAELFDPNDRRYAYPFLNCTNCGPRLTIIQGAPYDRARTTMSRFPMCGACRREYEDPRNRRFHAEPTCCANCGPRLALLDANGHSIATNDPTREFANALIAGQIGAIKGLGGFHLTCDATDSEAALRLRQRKHRDEKPFAIMVRNLDAAEALCKISDEEKHLLTSPQRPVVLLRRRDAAINIMEQVAPNNPELGVMLPYTPVHHLLFSSLSTHHSSLPLVMTSGNRSDEPIARTNEEAIEKLAGIADLFLISDRDIHVRCDDSVTRIIGGLAAPIRRSRGYAPTPIKLPIACPTPILAVGGQLKNTFALGRDKDAILSHHLGDLDQFEAYRAFERDITLYEELFEVSPAAIAHDLHPDYASTRYALRRAADTNTQLIAVQHHHAHLASCMAEHGLNEKTIGVCFDGTGYGTDGTIWGGEFLVGDYLSFDRVAHLRYVAMPGGEQAIREPWRMAVSHLIDVELPLNSITSRVGEEKISIAQKLIVRRFRSPSTSSMGRLFDAVASIIGVRDVVTYEGQAAVELEALATQSDSDDFYHCELATTWNNKEDALTIDTRPIIAAVRQDAADRTPLSLIARRFHLAIAHMVHAVCEKVRGQTGLNCVALTGGTFLNALLASRAQILLERDGFRVYRQSKAPAGDGGLCLGQLAVAARRLEKA